MAFNKSVKIFAVLCITAILWIALCGCDDLGAYSDPEEYYSCFGDLVFIDGVTGEDEDYSVEGYFYNNESRENFLEGEDGVYSGVPYGNYVYVAIPFESSIEMDTIALYICSSSDVTVYMNVYVVDKIPSEWSMLGDYETKEDEDSGDGSSDDSSSEKEYDDPDPLSRIGEITVSLEKEKWSSFVLDSFNVDGAAQKSLQINDGQYVLLQIRNNSGVRIFDAEKQLWVDPQTGLELQKAEITMTNLLIRALSIDSSTEA